MLRAPTSSEDSPGPPRCWRCWAGRCDGGGRWWWLRGTRCVLLLGRPLPRYNRVHCSVFSPASASHHENDIVGPAIEGASQGCFLSFVDRQHARASKKGKGKKGKDKASRQREMQSSFLRLNTLVFSSQQGPPTQLPRPPLGTSKHLCIALGGNSGRLTAVWAASRRARPRGLDAARQSRCTCACRRCGTRAARCPLRSGSPP
eukprot:COSAG04_NODE_1187_length_7847_cov_3.494579_3_plen_203_part_00